MMEAGTGYAVSDQALGVEENLAYVKRECVGQEWVWSIYLASNGERIGYAVDQKTAFALVQQNELTPMSVH